MRIFECLADPKAVPNPHVLIGRVITMGIDDDYGHSQP